MHIEISSAHARWLLLAACALAGGASAQEGNCEAIRAQIESKIAASGATGFSVNVVDANASAVGQVVGSCALGTRKIVYARQGPSGTEGSAPPNPPRGTSMLTECRDGSTSVGGDCKR